MRESWKAARVGLMVLVGIVGSVLVYRYVDERSQAGEGYRVYALFGDAQGLIPKSRVVIAGIPVGFIDEITLEACDESTDEDCTGSRARVDVLIDANVPLYDDASIVMRTVSLLGEKVLVIEPGGPPRD